LVSDASAGGPPWAASLPTLGVVSVLRWPAGGPIRLNQIAVSASQKADLAVRPAGPLGDRGQCQAAFKPVEDLGGFGVGVHGRSCLSLALD
jgi:hypothetical protein